MEQIIKAKYIVLENEVLEDHYLVIEDGKFKQTTDHIPENSQVIDYGDAYISAGLVDTHIHGYKNADVMDADAEAIQTIANGIVENGVTSWLPTTLTASVEQLDAACQVIGENADKITGAKIQGIFLEGPYFTEKYKGAQNKDYMSDPSIEQLLKWQELANGLVKKIAIAPERQGVKEFIKVAKENGIYVALGHSDATYHQAALAVQDGANIFVHTFNGMRGIHHREPGMVGAALNLKDVYAEVIADGFHVHPAAIELIVKSRGTDETALVTDCMRAGGMPDGRSTLGEFEVMVQDGMARLVSDGNLAGSILKMIDGVKNMVNWGIVSLPEALRMASLNPAKSVGIDDICGKIEAGYAADFIVVTHNAELVVTYIDGEMKYQKDEKQAK